MIPTVSVTFHVHLQSYFMQTDFYQLFFGKRNQNYTSQFYFLQKQGSEAKEITQDFEAPKTIKSIKKL